MVFLFIIHYTYYKKNIKWSWLAFVLLIPLFQLINRVLVRLLLRQLILFTGSFWKAPRCCIFLKSVVISYTAHHHQRVDPPFPIFSKDIKDAVNTSIFSVITWNLWLAANTWKRIDLPFCVNYAESDWFFFPKQWSNSITLETVSNSSLRNICKFCAGFTETINANSGVRH